MHKTMQQAGAGAAWLNIASAEDGTEHIESGGIVCSSVPGRQAVPRAEAHAPLALARVLEHSHARDCPAFDAWKADASYVTRSVAKHVSSSCDKSLAEGINGDLWYKLEAMVDAGSLPVPSKVKSHISLAEAGQSAQSWIDYVGNSLADCAAGAAAALLVPDGIQSMELEREERLAFFCAH